MDVDEDDDESAILTMPRRRARAQRRRRNLAGAPHGLSGVATPPHISFLSARTRAPAVARAVAHSGCSRAMALRLSWRSSCSRAARANSRV